MRYRTIGDIRAANKATGGRFFERETMDFFNSRLESGVIGGRYFVTSEQFCPRDGDCEGRRYTVRVADDCGRIRSVGNFEEHATREDAVKRADRIAATMQDARDAGPEEWAAAGEMLAALRAGK